MPEGDIDLEHLRRWIGRTETASERLTPSLVERFAATFDLDWTTGEGRPAPHLIHWCLAQPAARTASLGPDGHPARGGFLPPVPLPRRMRAGGRVVFRSEIPIGALVERSSRIADVSLKQGRTGRLCFVTVEDVIRADGAIAFEERHDIVYREAAGAAAPPPDERPVETGSETRPVTISTVLLFRYSALTFNGHRFHYDHPYATQVEGYPGLVVHGPLQATLLHHFARTLAGRPPVRFAFRSLSPLFDSDAVELHARRSADGYDLWTARAGGPPAMRASASWA